MEEIMRLAGKTAIVVGAGQGPGEGMGNGRATAIMFAREGAKVLAVDNKLDSAKETAALVAKEGGACVAFEADVTKEATLQAAVAEAMKLWRRIDILHNNVGVSLAGGDATPLEITEAAFDRVNAINLRGTVMACKHVLPIMRQQRSGSIINIASIAALAANYPTVAYKTTKAGMIAYTEQIACQNAEYGVRCNAILPGLMDTPMAVDTRARTWGKTRAEVAAMRDAKVPLRRRMGTAWDVANAALFLASDEANFITGIALPVDGGSSLRKE
jgi:NAD(P)-dependent dehydrogenase (short-subunit alcohol dehydrogenase family)